MKQEITDFAEESVELVKSLVKLRDTQFLKLIEKLYPIGTKVTYYAGKARDEENNLCDAKCSGVVQDYGEMHSCWEHAPGMQLFVKVEGDEALHVVWPGHIEDSL